MNVYIKWNIVVCVYICILYLVYPFICQWIFLLVRYFGCFHVLVIVKSFNEHWGACIFSNQVFLWIYAWNGIAAAAAAAKSLQLCPTLCNPTEPVLPPTRLLHPWNSPGKNTGVGCHFLLQGIFLTQGLNPGLLHCRQILYQLSYKERS